MGVPALILEVRRKDMTALVDYGDGVPREVLIGISEERVEPGDIVIVHAGVVVSKMSREEVVEQIEFFEEALGEEAEGFVEVYKNILEKHKALKGGG
ncbi:MAG: HypC/HybG/HupF family hydrogenase formation chaperone [Desulfurococcus sp.]|nr:HypC/HybG/HupF family hydrogenase formation chaperone [Desulfurococcus sp.]